jgi:excisionase family DNA binding protein
METTVFDDDDLMTINELSQMTKIPIGTVRKYILKKWIPYVKLGTAVRFHRKRIKEWIVQNSCDVQRRQARN